MGHIVQKKLPSALEIQKKFPISETEKTAVKQHQNEIKDILSGKDTRKILIVGPCSAWPSESVLEYAEKLKKIAEKVDDRVKIVMRVYLQKPRTTIGWLGPLNQPDPFLAPDMELGIEYCRKMMVEVTKMGLPMADEALFTHNDSYFLDLLSWVAIGARSAEDQEHRIFSSMIDLPVGIKNNTAGNIEIGINSLIAAQYSHVFAFHGNQIKTTGNPHAHLILRGGLSGPNYDKVSIETVIKSMDFHKIQNPGIIVDLSHDNSIDPETGQKNPLAQPKIMHHVLENMKKFPEINAHIKGFMAESFLAEGKQDIKKCQSLDNVVPGLSITDGCLGLKKTELMIWELAETTE